MVAVITATPNTSGGYTALALSGFGATTSANVVRIDLSGNVVSVRNGDPVTISAGSASLQDYEAPTDVAVTYEAQDVSTGATLAASSSATLSSAGLIWLGHPGKPSLNMHVTIREWQPGTRRARSGTFDVIGRSLPVARSLQRSGPAGQMVIRTDTFAERDALRDLLDDGYPLLLRAPTTPDDWGIGAMYLSIGDVPEDLLVRTPFYPKRFVALPWTEVDRPAGLAQGGPGFRWSDVIAAYATWTATKTANAHWSNVLDGVP